MLNMSLEGHLGELRRALLIALGAMAVATVLCFIFNRPLMELLMRPAGPIKFIFVAPAESFMATIKVSALGGLFLSLPIMLHQLYWFVKPGLTSKERSYAGPLLLAAYGFFVLGVVFAYTLMLPLGLKFLYGFIMVDNLSAMPSIGNYVSFTATFLLVTGLIFELPLILLFLTVIRIVNAEFLAQHRRYAIVGSFFVAMVVSPSADAFTQFLMAGALIGLYEVSIWLIRFVAPSYIEPPLLQRRLSVASTAPVESERSSRGE